jgi:hypothetical protein
MFGLLWWQSNLVARIAMDFFSRTCVTAQDSFTGSNEEKTEGVAGLVGYRVGQRAHKPNPHVYVAQSGVSR